MRSCRKWAGMILLPGLLLAAVCFGQGRLPDAGIGPVTIENLRLPDYGEDGRLRSVMFGERAVKDGQVVRITQARVELYEEGRLHTTMWAAACAYDMETGILTSDTAVRLTRAGLVVTGEGLHWKNGETVVTILRNVRVATVQGKEWFKRETR